MWMAYDEVKWGDHHEDVFPVWRYVWSLKRWHVATSANHIKEVRLVISYCCAIFCSYTILNFVEVVHDIKPKSCSRSYVHFCVPWILGDLSKDPRTGTANDFDCCLHWLSIHVGKCLIARPWFSWGLVGWGACHHICRGVLPLHYHPQLYIMCYLVVKISTLIWQVNTKRSNNKISQFLLV